MADIQSRRLFVGRLAALAVAPSLMSRTQGAELARLDVNDPAARALGYVENADRVDAKKYPAYVKGSNCENCLQLAGKAGNNYRPCALFPGKLVSVSGWCSGWAAEM
jgi:High potential iron-sulfur protein